MKKSLILLFTIILCLLVNSANAQVSRFINKVTKSVAADISGKPENSAKTVNKEPEPKCACEQAELVVDLGGKLKLMYSEISITIRDDGAILLKDRISNEFYIVSNGITEGPYKAGDQKLAGFENLDSADKPEAKSRWINNEYITSSGDKYLIKFNGKSYGPFGDIREFKVSKSKDKFAAIVVENVPVSEADGKKMDAAIKNAKTEQEKRELAMKYQQQMMQKMQQGGGPMSIMPKLITNIDGVNWDPLKSVGGSLNNNVKYDDILITTYDKVIDLSNKVLIELKPDSQNPEALFVNSNNTRYAWYRYGTLTFGDGAAMSDLFNPHLVKVNGQVYLAYMYYSPKSNGIMQCKIPF